MNISALADSETAVDSGPPFVFNPWKFKEIRRLYVNLPDGTNVGYLDLATLVAVPEEGGTQEQLARALGQLGATLAGAVAAAPAVAVDPVVPEGRSALDRPGPQHPGPVHRRPGRRELQDRGRGEQRTAGVLASLERQGYRILNSVPLSPRKDIDHLVIGPTGLFAISTKATTYGVAAKSDGTVYTDGHRRNWIESITRAAGYLAIAARMEMDMRPLVAVWSTIGVTSASSSLVAGEDITRRIAEGAHVYPDTWV